jgi:hypothetical protein
MPARGLTSDERRANVTRVADHHAEAALAHLLHVNRQSVTDELFAALQSDLSGVLAERLYKLDIRAIVRSPA